MPDIERSKKKGPKITPRISAQTGYPNFERILKLNAEGSDFVLGKEISYVDLSLFHIYGLR